MKTTKFWIKNTNHILIIYFILYIFVAVPIQCKIVFPWLIVLFGTHSLMLFYGGLLLFVPFIICIFHVKWRDEQEEKE